MHSVFTCINHSRYIHIFLYIVLRMSNMTSLTFNVKKYVHDYKGPFHMWISCIAPYQITSYTNLTCSQIHDFKKKDEHHSRGSITFPTCEHFLLLCYKTWVHVFRLFKLLVNIWIQQCWPQTILNCESYTLNLNPKPNSMFSNFWM